MNKKLIIIRNQFCCLLTIAIIAGLGGCAQKPIKKPSEKPPVTGEEIPEEKTEKEAMLIKILMAEAEKFSGEDNNQDALFVYKQALAWAEPWAREDIL